MDITQYLYEISDRLTYNKHDLIQEAEGIGFSHAKNYSWRDTHEARIEDMETVAENYPIVNGVKNQIENLFDCTIGPIVFYKVFVGDNLGVHKDPLNVPGKPKCSVNILLTDDNDENLKFSETYIGNDYDAMTDAIYQAALFKASDIWHGIPPVNKERIFLRLFIKDVTFEQAVEIIQSE